MSNEHKKHVEQKTDERLFDLAQDYYDDDNDTETNGLFHTFHTDSYFYRFAQIYCALHALIESDEFLCCLEVFRQLNNIESPGPVVIDNKRKIEQIGNEMYEVQWIVYRLIVISRSYSKTPEKIPFYYVDAEKDFYALNNSIRFSPATTKIKKCMEAIRANNPSSLMGLLLSPFVFVSRDRHTKENKEWLQSKWKTYGRAPLLKWTESLIRSRKYTNTTLERLNDIRIMLKEHETSKRVHSCYAHILLSILVKEDEEEQET